MRPPRRRQAHARYWRPPAFRGCCPAFTRELQQVRWPSVRTFKPEIPEKYDGRLNPAEFLSIYTIAVQAAGGRDEKVFANYFPLALKSNVRSWLMHLPEYSISSWADLCHGLSMPSPVATKSPASPTTCSFSSRRKEKPSVSIYRDSVKFIEIFQISIWQLL